MEKARIPPLGAQRPFSITVLRPCPGISPYHLLYKNLFSKADAKVCALFELPVQQKSAGLMVAKPTNRRSTFCIYFFLHLAAFRAEKGRRGGVTGILWSDPGFNVLLWLHKPRKYLFFRTQISGK